MVIENKLKLIGRIVLCGMWVNIYGCWLVEMKEIKIDFYNFIEIY